MLYAAQFAGMDVDCVYKLSEIKTEFAKFHGDMCVVFDHGNDEGVFDSLSWAELNLIFKNHSMTLLCVCNGNVAKIRAKFSGEFNKNVAIVTFPGKVYTNINRGFIYAFLGAFREMMHNFKDGSMESMIRDIENLSKSIEARRERDEAEVSAQLMRFRNQ